MLRSITCLLVLAAACGDDDHAAPDALVLLPDAPADTASQCNAIAPPATTVTVVRVASAPPTPQGGIIVPGRYVVTDVTDSTGAGGQTGPTGLIAQAENLTDADGVHFHYTQRVVDSNGTSEEHSAGTYVTAGVMLTITNTCPNTVTTTFAYDASPARFVLYQKLPGPQTRALTFTKQ